MKRLVDILWWNRVGLVPPPSWRGTREAYVRDCFPERLLLARIFEGRARFFSRDWWLMRISVWLLPPVKR
jgi:hypothetical protein